MKLETFTFQKKKGWSVEEMPKMDSAKTVVFAFCSPSLKESDKPIKTLREAFPNSHLLGCSSSGEIFEDQVMDDSMSVAVVQFERAEVLQATAVVSQPEASFAAGEQIGEKLLRDDLRAVLILSDGINVNGSELTMGVNSILPKEVIVTGGLAGDGDRFKDTWVLNNSGLKSNEVVAMGFYGDSLIFGHGSEGGWDIFGPERTITKSEGNVVYEIDDRPALELYKEYLGDRANELPASALLFPLAIHCNHHGSLLVRTILGVDEKTQSMTFAGDVKQGAIAQLMKCNFEQLVAGAGHSAEQANVGFFPEYPMLCIAISCVGRRLVLGQRTDDELEAVVDKLLPNTKQVGYYSYGEISPFGGAPGGYCDLHNQTMTLTLISEN